MSSSFLLGAFVGAALGAGAMYAALERPWEGGEEAISEVGLDGGIRRRAVPDKRRGKARRHRSRSGRGAGKEAGLLIIDERVQLTAADRKVSWKGPRVSLPERSVDMGASGGGRSLNETEIADAVGRGQSALTACIASARGQAELAANITLKILVDGDGGIGRVRVRAPAYLFKNGLYACLGKAARRMRFPDLGEATVVTVPLALSY